MDEATMTVVNAILNAGGTGVIVWLLIRLEARMAARDAQIWALIEWLVKQPARSVDDIPRG